MLHVYSFVCRKATYVYAVYVFVGICKPRDARERRDGKTVKLLRGKNTSQTTYYRESTTIHSQSLLVSLKLIQPVEGRLVTESTKLHS